ncbi:MAG: Gfo/Idh/MocA family oxidoreductase [Solirubrobacterales bacterium]
MTATVRVGVVGCGLICQWQHLPSLIEHPQAQVACVCDIDPHRRNLAARATSAAPVADLDEMLAIGVDAVLIATHDLAHAELAEVALEHGKHVFVEKPLALTVAEAERVAELAAEAQTVVAVGLQRLHDPALRQLTSELPAVGRLSLVHLHDFCHSNESVISESLPAHLTDRAFMSGRRDFGEAARWMGILEREFPGFRPEMADSYRLFVNLVCHDLSVLVAVLGEPTAVEFASISTQRFGVIVLSFGEVTAVLEFGQTGRKWFDERLRVLGEAGTLEASWATPFVVGVPTQYVARSMRGTVDVHETLQFTHRSLFRAELWDFIDRIITPSPPDGSMANAVTVTRWLSKSIEYDIQRRALADGG